MGMKLRINMRNTPLTADQNVFTLVNRISNWKPVYRHLGLGDVVDSKKPTQSKRCPKNPSDKKHSTKFRMREGWEETGRCHHNDIEGGGSIGPVEFIQWFLNRSDPIDAAMEILYAAGIEFEDLRRKNYIAETPLNPVAVPILTDADIAERKVKVYNAGVKTIQSIAKNWSKGSDLNHPEALNLLDKYMQVRGFPVGHVNRMPKHLRVSFNLCYHKSLRDDADNNAWYAGFLIPVCDSKGNRVTIHRHFFKKNTGELIPETKRKLMMSTPWDLTPGSHLEYDKPVNFTTESGDLAVFYQLGEGVETMEAVRLITEQPVQPMFSTGLLQNFVPLESDIIGVKPENVIVDFWLDKDKPLATDPLGRGPGEIAADRAIERLSKLGYTCTKLMPPLEIPDGSKGVDWLDAYNQLGLEYLQDLTANM